MHVQLTGDAGRDAENAGQENAGQVNFGGRECMTGK